MSASEILRARTAPAHAMVDAAFGDFDLADRKSYVSFLTAHARALPAAEAVVSGAPDLPALRPRTPLLASDMTMLGGAMPPTRCFTPPGGEAGLWGVLYVVEGSRLGGGMLAQRVGAGLPSAYLAARHLPGEWRDFRTALNAAATDAAWLEAAIAGAEACFALYGEAA